MHASNTIRSKRIARARVFQAPLLDFTRSGTMSGRGGFGGSNPPPVANLFPASEPTSNDENNDYQNLSTTFSPR
jgi:hypothetical protein